MTLRAGCPSFFFAGGSGQPDAKKKCGDGGSGGIYFWFLKIYHWMTQHRGVMARCGGRRGSEVDDDAVDRVGDGGGGAVNDAIVRGDTSDGCRWPTRDCMIRSDGGDDDDMRSGWRKKNWHFLQAG